MKTTKKTVLIKSLKILIFNITIFSIINCSATSELKKSPCANENTTIQKAKNV